MQILAVDEVVEVLNEQDNQENIQVLNEEPDSYEFKIKDLINYQIDCIYPPN